MKITLNLPEYDNPGYREVQADGFDNTPGLCPVCGFELRNITARLDPLGWVHAEVDTDNDETGPTCLEKAVQQLTQDPRAAWLTVAQHVAKRPHRHSAATIRAALTNVANLAPPSAGDGPNTEAAIGDLTAKLREIHTNEGGGCGTCADETGQAASWPCPTIRAVYVNEAVRAGA
jgi:hypothetical protein